MHDLIQAGGKQNAILAGLDRPVIVAAAHYMAEEDSGLGFAYSGWAQCALPHNRVADDAHWDITSEKIRLVVEPGRRPIEGSDDLQWIGVPYGSHARLILLYLQTEALRMSSREVELGRSLREWLGKLGISVGGMSGKSVRDQAERISRCRLTCRGLRGLAWSTRISSIGPYSSKKAPINKGGSVLKVQSSLKDFSSSSKKHPVPLEEAAIKALSNNAPALGAYLRLAYRLHVLKGDRLVT